jgi:hypothetical protein
MKPDPNYAPEWLFVRKLTMTSMSEFLVVDDQRFPTLQTAISGAWVNNPDVEGGDVILPPGVEPGVSTFDPDEEE